MADSNVLDFKRGEPPQPPGPPGPSVRKKRRLRKVIPDIERALMERQTTIWNALAILDLINYAQPSRDGMSWKEWNAVQMSVDAAAELLRKVNDLNEPNELEKAGAALRENE